MSKLESAFSKALREQTRSHKASNVGDSSQLEPEDGESSNGNHASPSHSMIVDGLRGSYTKNMKDLVSAKTQISDMENRVTLSDEVLASKRLVYPRMKDKELLTIYRNLRTKLLASSSAKNFTTLVTSVVSGGGSSLISANIAATFAFDEGKTSLLVEGNVHTPSLGSLFGLKENSKGLMECLESEQLSVNNILYETGIPRLRFIPSGQSRENSAEYFTSEKMKHIISEIKERYPERYPIIDAPSISESADTRILLALCDWVVLVIPYGLCTEDEIRSAVNIIGKEKLAGTVLNQF